MKFKERLQILKESINDKLFEVAASLPTANGNCGTNSRALQKQFNGEIKPVIIYDNNNGISINGHYIYISPDNNYIVDAVLPNNGEPNLSNVVRHLKQAELKKNVFDKNTYYSIIKRHL